MTTELVIFGIPLEVLSVVLDYLITGDNEAVLVFNTCKRWQAVVVEWKRPGKFRLSLRYFVRTVPLFLWARHNGSGPRDDMATFLIAVEGGCSELVKYLVELDYPWNNMAYCVAAQSGCLEVLQYLTQVRRESWLRQRCAYLAADNGHLEVLKWLKNYCRVQLTVDISSQATRGGHLHILKWLKAEGCPWDNLTCFFAALCNHLEVLKWLRANGCPWSKETCRAHVTGTQRAEIAKWIDEQPA